MLGSKPNSLHQIPNTFPAENLDFGRDFFLRIFVTF